MLTNVFYACCYLTMLCRPQYIFLGFVYRSYCPVLCYDEESSDPESDDVLLLASVSQNTGSISCIICACLLSLGFSYCIMCCSAIF